MSQGGTGDVPGDFATDNEQSEQDPPDRGKPKAVSRRRALQILGVVPAAAALGVQHPRTAYASDGSAPPAPSIASGAPALAPQFFTQHEWRTVRILVDYIIPRDEHSGSATEAKVPEYIDYLLAEKDANVNGQIAMRGGLAWLDAECAKRFQKTFIAASDTQRREMLDAIAYPAKAEPGMSYGVTFFNRFRDMTASGFFSSSMGWNDVKYMGNVFNPGYDGCPPAALDKLGVSYDVMKTRIAPEQRGG